MTSSETQTVDRETIANDFRERMEGKLDEEKIDAAANAITSATGVYPAHGSLASFIFYVKVQVVVDNGKTFDGSSNLLGHFQSGAVTTVLGIGGGTGSWS